MVDSLHGDCRGQRGYNTPEEETRPYRIERTEQEKLASDFVNLHYYHIIQSIETDAIESSK